jgi:hypothetical protein
MPAPATLAKLTRNCYKKFKKDIYKDLNEARRDVCVSKLNTNSTLEKYAQKYSETLAKRHVSYKPPVLDHSRNASKIGGELSPYPIGENLYFIKTDTFDDPFTCGSK